VKNRIPEQVYPVLKRTACGLRPHRIQGGVEFPFFQELHMGKGNNSHRKEVKKKKAKDKPKPPPPRR
jgi:hypothetical protein